jgi:hypothetical protein
MFHTMLRPGLTVLAAVGGTCGMFAATAAAQPPASITVQPELTYNVTTLTINGSATCAGGGSAGVNVVNGSLYQMFQGGIGGPIAMQLSGPVLVACDGAPHIWQGHLVAPGRALPNDSGGMVTVTLAEGANTIATTGSQPVHIVR